MKTDDLIKALNRLKVQIGSLACLGCKYEDACGVHGCAIIREAAERLAELERERTALLADLKRFGGCMGCKGYADKTHEPCLRCDDTRSAWEWKGEAAHDD